MCHVRKTGSERHAASLTFQEIKEKLGREDPSYLLELLDISAEELLDRFEDHIEERFDILHDFVSEEGE